MMVLRAALIWLLALGGARAHDIGAIEARLTEHASARYTLTVPTPSGLASLVAPPQLPERCRLIDERRTADLRFVFACNGLPLHSDDVLVLRWPHDAVLLSVHWSGADAVTARLFLAHAGRIEVPLASLQAGTSSMVAAAVRYTSLGVEHILFGIDHLLFVLALLLIARGVWSLLATITAFTLAHSVTLGLATLGWVNVPGAPVEAAIALSIVLVAAEGVRQRDDRSPLQAPWPMAFAFGLLHGFGFAGALSELGLPASDVPLALLFFNLGVELGQLAFVACALLVWRGVRMVRGTWPRRAAVLPGYVIGTVAMFWFLERLAAILAA